MNNAVTGSIADTNSSPALLRDVEIVERLKRTTDVKDSSTLLALENMVHLIKTYNSVYDILTDLLAPYDLTVPKYNLLVILYNMPDHHLSMSEIGERMSFTRTNITKLVDSLERQGLAQRKNQPGDRRVVLAELTESGVALARRILPLHCHNIRTLWTGITEDERILFTHLLLKLRQNVVSCAEEAATYHELQSK